jgi:hypothetical protein
MSAAPTLEDTTTVIRITLSSTRLPNWRRSTLNTLDAVFFIVADNYLLYDQIQLMQ